MTIVFSSCPSSLSTSSTNQRRCHALPAYAMPAFFSLFLKSHPALTVSLVFSILGFLFDSTGAWRRREAAHGGGREGWA